MQPCTNCQKGKKSCTFEWLRELGSETVQDGKRKRSREPALKSSAQSVSPLAQHKRRVGSLVEMDSQGSVESLDRLPPINSSKEFHNTTEPQPIYQEQPGAFTSDPPPLGFYSKSFSNIDSLETVQDYSEQDDVTDPSINTSTGYGSQPSESGVFSFEEPTPLRNVRRRRKSQTQLWDRRQSETSLLSSLDMAATTSRYFVTSGLQRIYHDSLENALSCWLTEHNCPYTSITRRKNPIIALESAHVTMSEWGSTWSNRIYSRVCHLDMAYSSVRGRPLSRNEERMVSQALNLAVLSFAAQWAQAGDRSKTSPRAEDSLGTGINTGEFPLSDDFGRSMQETLWHQASRVLHEAAGIESFRVVFALIIFSMTQRPLDITQTTPRRPVYGDLQRIIEADGPPLFLEMGLRQAFSYRRKLENIERQRAGGSNPGGASPKKSLLQQEDHETINMLFWLGVMFDTLSAAMCHRPLVVEDEDTKASTVKPCDDSPHISPQSSTSNTQLNEWEGFSTFENLQTPNELWGDRFLSVKAGTAEPTRWPCSYQLAATTLSDAAPVKVLLFRRVTRLETLLSRGSDAAELESAINDAFHVYDYWNRIYGPFMLDCIAYHDELPPRIQSWYILLAGHWHLATFLLADLIKVIDNTNMSQPTERKARQLSHLVAKLRQENARAVSELSRASLHGSQGRSFPKSHEFHFAVNKAALLTEPWTVVLIRSFSRAGYILAKAAVTESQSLFVHQARHRCDSCIEALWFLGKKSDMAFLAARLLANMLNQPHVNTSSPLATSDSQPSVNSEKRYPHHISLQSSYSTVDNESYFDTEFSELPVGQGFGLESIGGDSIPDMQSYSMLGDPMADEEGFSGSPWGPQYYPARSFEPC